MSIEFKLTDLRKIYETFSKSSSKCVQCSFCNNELQVRSLKTHIVMKSCKVLQSFQQKKQNKIIKDFKKMFNDLSTDKKVEKHSFEISILENVSFVRKITNINSNKKKSILWEFERNGQTHQVTTAFLQQSKKGQALMKKAYRAIKKQTQIQTQTQTHSQSQTHSQILSKILFHPDIIIISENEKKILSRLSRFPQLSQPSSDFSFSEKIISDFQKSIQTPFSSIQISSTKSTISTTSTSSFNQNKSSKSSLLSSPSLDFSTISGSELEEEIFAGLTDNETDSSYDEGSENEKEFSCESSNDK